MTVPSYDFGLSGGPTVFTLTTLRNRVRERVDMVGSSFITDTSTSLDAWINEANQKLHGMLVDAYGEEYASSESDFTTVANQSDYAIATGFFKLYGVDLNYNGDWRTLLPYTRAERNTYRNSRTMGWSLPKYALVGNYVRLYPTPQAGLSGKILFAPGPATLASGTDTVEYPNGWDRFIVVDAAIQALAKEESSASALIAEREAIRQEIEKAKELRDLAAPRQVTDMDNVDTEPWL